MDRWSHNFIATYINLTRNLADLYIILPFVNRRRLANRSLKFANGYGLCMERNILYGES